MDQIQRRKGSMTCKCQYSPNKFIDLINFTLESLVYFVDLVKMILKFICEKKGQNFPSIPVKNLRKGEMPHEIS